MLLQILLAAKGKTREEEETVALRPNTGSNIKVAKLPTFNREISRVIALH